MAPLGIGTPSRRCWSSPVACPSPPRARVLASGGTPRRPFAVRCGWVGSPGSPVALRPTDGNADPQGHGYTVPSQHLCGPHLCVHWVNVDVRRAALRSTATATGSPTRSSPRSTRSRRPGGSRSCAWGSARRSPTGRSADHGPNDELDVYLADVGALGLERVRGDRRPARARTTAISTATTPRTWSSTTTSRSRSSVRAEAPEACARPPRTSSSTPCSSRTTRARTRG